jgi:hypothetical protein
VNPRYQNIFHSTVFGLNNDDHLQYLHLSNPRIISANHVFSGLIPFTISGTGFGVLISGLNSNFLNGYTSNDFALINHTHTTGQIINFTTGVYDAVNPWITGKLVNGNGISITNLGNTLQFSVSGLNNLLPTGFNANQIGNGTVDNTEYGFLDGVTSNIQTQLNSKISSNQLITLSGDVSATGQTTIPVVLSNVNSSTGIFTNATITINSKGLITSASNGPVFAPTGVSYITLSTDSILTNERVLTAGQGISFVDQGSNSNLIINVSGLADYLMPTGINVEKLGLGTVDNTVLDYLSTLTGDVQSQLDSKGSGTVTNISNVNASGIVIHITNPASTPSLSVGLQRIVPVSVVATQHVSGINLTGTNTGDQLITLSGDIVGTGNTTIPVTLPNVNSNVGTFSYPTITINSKGQVTSASSNNPLVYAPTGSAYITIGNDSNLASERSITAGSGINFVDNGAGNTFIIHVQPTGIDHNNLNNLSVGDVHSQYHNDSRALTWLGTRSTSDLPQGANEYYTSNKVRSVVTGFLIAGNGIELSGNINNYRINISGLADYLMPTGINANKIGLGTVDNTKLNYLSTATSNIQTQLDSKLSSNQLISIQGAVIGTGTTTINVLPELIDTQIPDTYQFATVTTDPYGRITAISNGVPPIYAQLNATYLTLSSTTGLTSERVLTAGTGINFTDSGAGGILRINVQATGLDHNSLNNLLVGDPHTQYFNTTRADTWLGTKTTSNLTEGSNLYFNSTRTRNEVTGFLIAGTNVVFNYNGTTSLTISVTGLTASSGGGSYTDEQAQDAVGTILNNSNNLQLYYNDVSNAISGFVLESNINIVNTTGILTIDRGGTNASTPTAALNNLLPTQTSGGFLFTDGQNTYFRKNEYNFGINIEGYPISTGVKGFSRIASASIIDKCDVFSSTTGTLQIDLLKSNSINYPTFTSILNNSLITLSNQNYVNQSITNWTTGLAAGDLLRFNVVNISGINNLNIHLTMEQN